MKEGTWVSVPRRDSVRKDGGFLVESRVVQYRGGMNVCRECTEFDVRRSGAFFNRHVTSNGSECEFPLTK